jgi:uncharacterized membrane protein AbrB (regulator of aidB expression)
MAANINPIYGRTSDLQLGGAIIGTSANTATDGTGANISAIYQADATEGSYVYTVRLKHVSSTAATVARLWYHSTTGAFTPGTTNTAANTTMIAEVTIAAFTASNTLASPTYEIPVNIAMPPGTRLLMTFGTSTGAATTGFNPLIIAMKY